MNSVVAKFQNTFNMYPHDFIYCIICDMYIIYVNVCNSGLKAHYNHIAEY